MLSNMGRVVHSCASQITQNDHRGDTTVVAGARDETLFLRPQWVVRDGELSMMAFYLESQSFFPSRKSFCRIVRDGEFSLGVSLSFVIIGPFFWVCDFLLLLNQKMNGGVSET